MTGNNTDKGFYLLQELIYRDLFKRDFDQKEYNYISFQVRKEYQVLKNHIETVIKTLKGKNQQIEVSVKTLSGKYLITPQFKKIICYKFIYRQEKLQKFNTHKKAIYQDQIIQLDQDFSFVSTVRMDVAKLFPFIGNEVADEVSFSETRIQDIPVKRNSYDIITTNHILFTLYNTQKNDEHRITIDDMRLILNHFGRHDIQINQQGDDFISDQEFNNDFIDSELTENSRVRIFIDSIHNKDTALDEVDYFFEELEGKFYAIYDSSGADKEEIIIRKRNRSQQTLIIEKKDLTEFTKPILRLRFDISLSNLNKQMYVLGSLILKPREINRNLIKIVYSNANFPNPKEYLINQFFFLKDLSYQGTSEQRSFVQKALATDDFMILSGPPGTGKTTAIMEFIIQALRKNSKTKILLSASTHIAIDNVLENLIKEFGDQLYKENIYPIRIGTSDSISEKLDEYSYEKIKEKFDLGLADLYLRSSNLVCGTTMGITKYLDTQKGKYEFDYLIIDEASKTTLQEFIVPAAMCDKFILVGDVNQLSPYTDTFMLETLLKSNPKVDYNLEDFAYNNYVIRDLKRSTQGKYLVVINSKNTVKMLSEWYKNQDYEFVYQKDHLELVYGNKSVIITKERYLEWIYFLPDTFSKIYTVEEYPSFIKTKKSDLIKDFVNQIEGDREISDNRIGSNWAKEVAWRYVRFHELNKIDKKYEEELDWLIPEKIKDVKSDIEELADIAIPSVLIKLQKGVKSKNFLSASNRFRTGFSENEKESRFVQLRYQHRMHSEISKYAEGSIYGGTLLTANTVNKKRNNMQLFNNHSIFVNVKSNKMCKQENEQEAVEIIRILKIIIDQVKKGSEAIKIGILTFYKAQEKLIRNYVRELMKLYGVEMLANAQIGNIFIEVFTVDKFQGKESEISIISLSRNRGLGFMNVPNRINVAMTRAKNYRIVVGDAEHFKQFEQPFLKNIYYDSVRYEEGDLK